VKLRPYQRRAVDAIARCLADNRSTLLVAATGLGKTVMLAHAIAEVSGGKRAMVLAHREELVTQNAKTIGAVLGEPCDIEMSTSHADLPNMMGRRARVIVASKDSLHPKRLERFDPDEFGLIVTDEAHHATSESYTRIYDYFSQSKHLGVTATPNRHDEEALGQVFETTAMIYGIADGIRDGWLVPIVAYSPIVHDLNLDRVKTVAGDLSQSELGAQLENERPVHEVCVTTIERCGDRRALLFAVSVRQAQMIADRLNNYRADCARFISGETPKEERAAVIAAHKRGQFQYLANCNVATEGYDDPGIGAVVMARPTKSLPLFTQMVGRGTRPMPGLVEDIDDAESRRDAIANSEKPNMLLLNFTSNCSRHKLVTPADVLGGKYPDEDCEAAGRAIMDGETDVAEALERAQQKRLESGGVKEIKAYDASRVRIVAQARYLLQEEDLFDGAFSPGRERTWQHGKAPTESQIATLERHGFKRDDINRMSRNECSKLLGGIVLRVQNGLCTIKQARYLASRGFKDADKMTFEEAKKHLDRLLGSRV